MNDEILENSDNPSGNEPQEPIEADAQSQQDVPLYLRDKSGIAEGNAQDLRDEAPE